MPRTLLIEAQSASNDDSAGAAPVSGQPGRFLLKLIDAGWGASGYYSPAVLEAAAKAKIFPSGLHSYIDHPHGDGSGVDERGNRSVKDLASVLAEDARWDAGLQALVAEANVFGTWRAPLDQMKDQIGLSVRAYAETTLGEAEGRSGVIVDELVEGISADYVTRAGRGGRIMAVLESAREVTEGRNIGQWVESRIHRDFTCLADDMAGEGRLTREERIQMSSAIGDALASFVTNLEANAPQLYQRDLWADPTDTVAEAMAFRSLAEATSDERRQQLVDVIKASYASETTYAWVRDFDESTVWFDVTDQTSRDRTWQQSYTVADDDLSVSLTGERTSVRPVTKYVPVTRPGSTTTTESLKEDTMPEIAESELARLREADGRVQTLESELSTERQQREAAETERNQLRESNAATQRATIVTRLVGEAATAANATLNEFETAGIAGRRVLAQDGTVDEAATRTAFDTAIASLAEARGAGAIRGFGRTAPPTPETVSEADLDALDDAIFGKIQEA